MTAETYSSVLAALCIWREARGECLEAKRGVMWVLKNRAAQPSGPYRKCKDIVSNILCPYQFSSFNKNDANAVKFPGPEDKSWLDCCAVVDDPGEDPTGGATHYFSVDIPSPDWAVVDKFTCRIGNFRFYKL